MSGREAAATEPPPAGAREPLGDDLPYRPNVGVVLLDRRGLVFCGRCFPNPHGWPDPEVAVDGADWCMPQGGVDPGEDLVAAARRELWEETGVVSADFVALAPGRFRYDFPVRGARGHKLHPFRGQEQRWAAFRFTGEDAEIRVDAAHTHEPAEFSEWRWRPVGDLLACGIAHRRAVYAGVAAFVATLAGAA